jgi:hypothetical protein
MKGKLQITNTNYKQKINEKLLRGVQGVPWHGDLLKFASFFISFPNSSPSPVTCTCHLWQKRAPLAAGGKKLLLTDFNVQAGDKKFCC